MPLPIVRHSSSFATLPQIGPQHLREVAAAGYKSVINNRPDGEGGNAQPSSAALQKAAEAQGLQYAYLPVNGRHLTADDVEDFRKLYARLPKPIAAFCRTGTRSTNLYRLANPDSREAQWI